MEQIEIELTTQVYGGEAMGRLADGRAVFVPYALEGERVLAQVREEKQRYARAALIEVLRPSPDRISPRCRHFGVCGGCHYQMLPYAQQLILKQRLIRDQFQRIAGVADPPVQPVVPSPQIWNYRNTVQFHLTSQGQPGYQQANSHQVVAISECHLPEPALNRIWPLLEIDPIPGLERIELRVGAGEEVLLTLEGSTPLPPEFEVDIPVSAVYLGSEGATVLAGDDHVLMSVLNRLFCVSAGSFFQVNTSLAEQMVEHVLANAALSGRETFLDLYCGVGLFSAFVAGRTAHCLGVEANPKACQDYALNLDEYDHVELYQGKAEDILPHLNQKIDVALVDPPRSGLERTALDALVRQQPERLIYVSCDPATLGRDARRLIDAGYRLEKITPFDLFPHTYHIESITIFRRQTPFR